MKSTRLSRNPKSPALAPVQNQCIDALLKNTAFLKAVRGGLAEDAAIVAVNIAMVCATSRKTHHLVAIVMLKCAIETCI